MAKIIEGKNSCKPYTVRYWHGGKQRERSFVTRQEATGFLAEFERLQGGSVNAASKVHLQGNWSDGRLTYKQLAGFGGIELPYPLPVFCGVYALTLNGNIQYVGKSVNVVGRMPGHQGKRFDGVYVLMLCPRDELSENEDRYIHLFHPPLNMTRCRHCDFWGDQNLARHPEGRPYETHHISEARNLEQWLESNREAA